MKQFFTKALIALAFIFLYGTTDAQTPFWTEDFSGGGVPTGWTNEDLSTTGVVFQWCNDPTAAGADCPSIFGDDLNMQLPFASETVNNGFLSADSDAANPAASAASPHMTQLTTASIDCSSQSSVWFVCQTHIGTFDLPAESNAILQVSNDGGSNWTDFTLFPGLLTGGPDPGVTRWSFNPQIPMIDISAVAGNQTDVQIRWNWTAGWEYQWSIDDVHLYDEDPSFLFLPKNEISSARSAAGNNGGTPVSQIYPVSFLIDVANLGLFDATGITANAKIENAINGSVMFDVTISIPNIAAGEEAQDNIWPTSFTPPNNADAIYNGFYSVSFDSLDENTSNDTIAFQFIITDSTFRKDLRSPSADGLSGIVPGSGEPDWTYAAGYYTPNGGEYAASSITFAIANAADVIGASIHVVLYRWEDINKNGIATANERGVGSDFQGGEILGDYIHIIDGTETGLNTDITVVLDNQTSGDHIMLEDGGQYIVAIEMTGSTAAGDPVSIVADDNISYLNSWFVNDSLSNIDPDTYVPQHGAFSAGDADGATALVQAFGFSPRIHMNINIPEVDATNNQLSPENKIKIFPNPVSETLNLDLDFVENFKAVNIRITDITGKELISRDLSNVEKSTSRFNTSTFAEGAYTLHVTTPNGVRTIRFVVAR